MAGKSGGRRRRSALAILIATIVALALAGPAQAAKTYNDPWLEGDLQQMRVPDALDILARTPQHVVVGDVDSGAFLSDPDLAPHLMRMPAPFLCADQYGPGPSYAADPSRDFGCDFIGGGDEAIPTTIPDGDPADPFDEGPQRAQIIEKTILAALNVFYIPPPSRISIRPALEPNARNERYRLAGCGHR